MSNLQVLTSIFLMFLSESCLHPRSLFFIKNLGIEVREVYRWKKDLVVICKQKKQKQKSVQRITYHQQTKMTMLRTLRTEKSNTLRITKNTIKIPIMLYTQKHPMLLIQKKTVLIATELRISHKIHAQICMQISMIQIHDFCYALHTMKL